MGLAIGIDLGTSNSSAAIYRKGKVESIPIEGKKILPSVVSFRNDGQALVGNAAKARLYIDPQNSVSSSKRFIGDSKKVYQIQGQSLTPVDVAQKILEKIRIESGKYLGGEVTDAVITIPAYFTSEQREATKKAGELAGFNVLRLLSEPTAAAIAYGLDKERNQTIMVYDLGGGTFDVSILKVENNSFKVVAVDGDSLLGGDDVDDTVAQYLLKSVSTDTSSNLHSEGSIALQRIKEAAEEAKKELSVSDFTDISIPDVFGTHIDEELDIDTFNSLIQPLLDRTIEKIEDTLASAGLTKRDISRVILVGGSTRIKAVQEIVTAQIKKPFIADNVDEIVAQGAAIMAANLSTPDYDSTPVPIEVEDAVSHSLGIDLVDSKDKVKKVFHLITKNSSLPCTGATFAWTLRPFQTAIRMGVFQTESEVPNDLDKLGELTLPVSSRAYHVSIVALFQIDENGILTFSSAEVEKDSPLMRAYDATDEVDIPLLEAMISDGRLKHKEVIIQTNK